MGQQRRFPSARSWMLRLVPMRWPVPGLCAPKRQYPKNPRFYAIATEPPDDDCP
jgi:hypothetical protein